jgi:hypothetical protein
VPVDVRRVRPEDWSDLRSLRLEALEDTPLGFLETLADAHAVCSMPGNPLLTVFC